MNIGLRNILLFNIVMTLIVGLMTFVVYEKANSILTTDPAKISSLSRWITDCADLEALRKKTNLFLETFVKSEAGKKEILQYSFLYFSSIFLLVFVLPNLYLLKRASHS